MLAYTGHIEPLSFKFPSDNLKNTELLKSIKFRQVCISWIISFILFSTLSNFSSIPPQMWELQNNPKCSYPSILPSPAQAGSDPTEHQERSLFPGDLPRWPHYRWRLTMCREGHAKSHCHHSHPSHVLLGEKRSKSSSLLTPPFWLHSSRLRKFLLILLFPSSEIQGRGDCCFPELLRNHFCLYAYLNFFCLRIQKWCFFHLRRITALVEWN